MLLLEVLQSWKRLPHRVHSCSGSLSMCLELGRVGSSKGEPQRGDPPVAGVDEVACEWDLHPAESTLQAAFAWGNPSTPRPPPGGLGRRWWFLLGNLGGAATALPWTRPGIAQLISATTWHLLYLLRLLLHWQRLLLHSLERLLHCHHLPSHLPTWPFNRLQPHPSASRRVHQGSEWHETRSASARTRQELCSSVVLLLIDVSELYLHHTPAQSWR